MYQNAYLVKRIFLTQPYRGLDATISNDFISSMDLWPWICALYIDNSYRGRSLGKELLLRAKADAEKAGCNK